MSLVGRRPGQPCRGWIAALLRIGAPYLCPLDRKSSHRRRTTAAPVLNFAMETTERGHARIDKEPRGAEAGKKARASKTEEMAVTPAVPTEAAARPAVPTGTGPAADNLPGLAMQIRRAYAETEEHVGRLGTALQAATEHALGVGRLLNRARELVPHGGWESWLADSVPGLSPRTARRWMLEAKRPTLADLNPVDRAMSHREAVRFLEDGPGRASAKNPTAKREAGTSEGDPAPGVPDVPGAAEEPFGPEASVAEQAAGHQAPGRATADGIVRSAVQLREMIGACWGPGIRLSPAQSMELHACERQLRRFREAMGGAEGKALSEDARDRRN